MIKEELSRRALPPVLVMNDGSACDSAEKWETRRREILELFSREVYGFMPAPPKDVAFKIIQTYEDAVGGYATFYRVRVTFTTPKVPFSFDFEFYTPNSIINVPVIVKMEFNESPSFRTYPVEEIVKNGFAVARFRSWDVMADRDDFSQGLAGMYLEHGERKPGEWGAIGAWAYGASRVMDWLQTLDFVDKSNIAITGHSRLGKTALWCAANDERYAVAMISASGNTGASLSRGNEGEHIADITKMFPHWFSTNYYKYAEREAETPFDQHFIAASLAPRYFYNCSGSTDTWAGPFSEYLCCAAVSPVYEMLGLRGFVAPDEAPRAGTVLHEGRVAYHMHEGGHYYGGMEWNNLMKYMRAIKKRRIQGEE